MKRFLLALLLSMPMLLIAQSNFQKGYVVTNDGDTVRGFIDYRESNRTPTEFNFKTYDGVIKQYSVANCAEYGVDNTDFFERYLIYISQSKVLTHELTVGPDSSSIRETVFLRVLQKGKYFTLYSYSDVRKQRFYLKANYNEVPFELKQQVYLSQTKQTVVVTNNLFRQQISSAIRNLKENVVNLDHKLRFLTYSEKEIKKIIAEANGQELTKSKVKAMKLFLGGGLMNSRATYGGDFGRPNAESKFESTYSPYFNAGVDFLVNPAVGKMIIRAEISTFSSKNDLSVIGAYSGDLTKHSHSFNAVNYVITPRILYNFYNVPSVKVFASVGASANISVYSNIRYRLTNVAGNPDVQYNYDDVVVMNDFYFSLPAGLGIVLNKRIELSAVYSYKTQITSGGSGYSIGMERLGIGINYLFGKH